MHVGGHLRACRLHVGGRADAELTCPTPYTQAAVNPILYSMCVEEGRVQEICFKKVRYEDSIPSHDEGSQRDDLP